MIHIRQDTIIVGARDNAGLLYGLYSLDQIVKTHTVNKTIPNLMINDFPKFEHRAVMDDISRGPLSNMTFLKAQIKRLSYLKINKLSFYIEHVVKTKKHPTFAPQDALTIEEFKLLSEFARPYHVELIGSFQSLGHFRNILSSPDYAYLGQTDRMLKPGHEQSLRFLTDVYGEMLPAFSSEYFNINADEAWDLVRGDLTELAKEIGPDQLYANHVKPLLDYLIANKKRPMIWGDMLLSYPNAFNNIPKNTTILTWEYSALDTFDDWIDPIQKAGFDFWVCPGIVNSYRVVPDYEEAFINIENFINEGFEKKADGVMTTIWDDGGGHLFGRDWAAVAWAAEQSWFPRRGTKNEFLSNFSRLFYQDEEQLLMKSIFKLAELKYTSSMQSLNTAFLDEVLLPTAGKKHFLNTKDLDIISHVLESAEILIKQIDTKHGIGYPEWIQDLEFWKLSMDHMTLHVKTYRDLLKISKYYQKGNINSAVGILKKVILEWTELKENFRRLWLLENRKHWITEASSVYNSKIEILSALQERIEPLGNSKTKELPSALDVGLDIVPNEENYFTFWLVADFYELDKKADLFVDHLVELGGELVARPTPYDWLKYQSPFSERVDLSLLNRELNNSVTYLYCRIESESDQVSLMDIQFDNYFEIILNGERLRKSTNLTNKLELVKGKNHLILKLGLDSDNHEISVRFKNLKVRNRKQKYKVIQH